MTIPHQYSFTSDAYHLKKDKYITDPKLINFVE